MVSTVIWWRARDSNPVYPEVEDLQSPEVTNASRSPYMVEVTGIEPATFWLQTKRSPN